ncbi:MAG: PhoU domain-containing protein [Xanthomonadaceae bacterium]|nr:PhoU domain-containing protein [Xanthomonadaceae bacterium]
MQAAGRGILDWLFGRGPGASARAVGALRITGDLRQIDRILSELDSRVHGPAHELPDDIAEQCRHIAGRVLVQLAACRKSLEADGSALAQRVLNDEAFLDEWHDVLPGDVLDELAEGHLPKSDLMPLLAIVRAMERIGHHARDIAESALAINTA